MVQTIKEKICRGKQELAAAFAAAEPDGDSVSLDAWVGVMRSVLHVEINFSKYARRLVDVGADGRVRVQQFLERYQVRLREQYAAWQHGVLMTFYNSLLASDLEVSEITAFFAPNDSGRVARAECVDALVQLNIGLSNGQIRQLISTLGFVASATKPSEHAFPTWPT